jgi:hypothetical protein
MVGLVLVLFLGLDKSVSTVAADGSSVSSENVIGRGLKPLPLVAARPSVVELPYVDTNVDAARLEARAT